MPLYAHDIEYLPNCSIPALLFKFPSEKLNRNKLSSISEFIWNKNDNKSVSFQ